MFPESASWNILQADKDVTPQQYVKWHPGGALGKLRDDEK
jgi:hypothetical protein